MKKNILLLILILTVFALPCLADYQVTVERFGGQRNGMAVRQLDSQGNFIDTETAHHAIHMGNHYFYRDALSIGATTQTYLLTTPDSDIEQHILFEADWLYETTLQVYESSDRVGTAAQTIINNNRRSTNTTTTTLHKGTSGGTTDGTLIFSVHQGTSSPSVNREGGGVREDNEIILKANTKYLFKFTSAAASNLINFHISYYEYEE